LDLLVEGGDLIVEQEVAGFDVRVLGGSTVGLLPGIGGRLTARRARLQCDPDSHDRADRDKNAPNRRKLAHSHERGR
jgi:hypothetical protein